MLLKHQRTVILVTQKTYLVHHSDYVNILLISALNYLWETVDFFLFDEFSFTTLLDVVSFNHSTDIMGFLCFCTIFFLLFVYVLLQWQYNRFVNILMRYSQWERRG